jgi:hypothetical protein
MSVTNDQGQGYQDCQLKVNLDKGDGARTYTGINCTVERTITTGTKDVVYVSFDLDERSVQDMSIEYTEAPPDDDIDPDDDVDPDDDTQDDDTQDDDVDPSDDQDGDGLPDWWETDHFGDLSQNSQGDHDGDGLSNYQEYLQGTDPMDPDDPETIGGDSGSDLTLVYVLVAVLIIIILVVIFIAIMKRKGRPLDDEEDEEKKR